MNPIRASDFVVPLKEVSRIDVQTQYNQIGEAYEKAQRRFIDEKGDKSREFILRSIGTLRDKRLLDVGCGHGEDLALYQQYHANVFGIDPSEVMVDLARKKVKSPINVMLGCAERIPFDDNSMDVVTSRFALHYVEHLDRAWREIGRVLRPGGVLAFTAPHPLTGFRRKGDRDYEETTLLRVKLFDEEVEVFSYSHTFQDYLSSQFFHDFVVEDFTEFPDMAPRAGDIGVPGAFGVKARRK